MDPVKIGAALTLTGGLAVNGQEALAGFRMYLGEFGGNAAGRPIAQPVGQG